MTITVDKPLFIAPSPQALPCPADCAGISCRQPDSEGSIFHQTYTEDVEVEDGGRIGVSMTRFDDPDDDGILRAGTGKVEVFVENGTREEAAYLQPASARRLASHLVRAADRAENRAGGPGSPTTDACPAWCAIDNCEGIHGSDGHTLPIVDADYGRGELTVGLIQCDPDGDEPGIATSVRLQMPAWMSFTDAGTVSANLTPWQAQRLGELLIAHASAASPDDLIVPVTEVKIGDLFPAGDGWLYVYGVLVDEPSADVQVCLTAEADHVPTEQEDDSPRHFWIADLVRVRRPLATAAVTA